ncbi:hypothetical protein [Haloarchaeobius sp. HME9146]|uniref:DUF7521 family protein n=1 Tax=Haloarchaeobius sp. HME9146 TaxID=2978732 RepID=UPI0021BE855A|nr:hypothetical protein [Haloarchaeobius sp. HME9146]MCT9095569.1 hypothetical protein [Haloarchaeobius sp. HME9146]
MGGRTIRMGIRMTPLDTALVAAQATTILVGTYLTTLARRAGRRTGASSLRSLAVGFACITLGAAIAGVVLGLAPTAAALGFSAQAAATAAGLVVIAVALRKTADPA